MAEGRDKRKRLKPELLPKFRPKEVISGKAAEGSWGDRGRGKGGTRRILKTMIAIVGAAAFAFVGYTVLSLSTGSPPATESTRVSEADEFENIGQEDGRDSTETAAKLLEKLTAYCNAESIAQRMEMVRSIEEVRPYMVRWAHLTGNPPIPLDGIVLSEAQLGVFDSGDRRFCRLTLSRGHQRKWSVFFEETEPGRFDIDWMSMVGCGDLLLADFLERKSEETVQLRVVARESDYYNFGFTPEEYTAFELHDPDQTHSAVAYASLNDPLVVGLTSLRYGSGSRKVIRKVIVDVRYESIQGLQPQVVVKKFVKSGWFLQD